MSTELEMVPCTIAARVLAERDMYSWDVDVSFESQVVSCTLSEILQLNSCHPIITYYGLKPFPIIERAK